MLFSFKCYEQRKLSKYLENMGVPHCTVYSNSLTQKHAIYYTMYSFYATNTIKFVILKSLSSECKLVFFILPEKYINIYFISSI